MKRNNIIYPNTPFFRKYAGKLIVPAGAEEEEGGDLPDFELCPEAILQLEIPDAINPQPCIYPGQGSVIVCYATIKEQWDNLSMWEAWIDNEKDFHNQGGSEIIDIDDDIISEIPNELQSWFRERKGRYLATLILGGEWELETDKDYNLRIMYEGIEVWSGVRQAIIMSNQ